MPNIFTTNIKNRFRINILLGVGIIIDTIIKISIRVQPAVLAIKKRERMNVYPKNKQTIIPA